MTEILFGSSSLRNLPKLRDFKRKRVSSFDKSGGNIDFIRLLPGEKKTIFNEDGPGCITHIWTTQLCRGEKYWLNNLIIRIWWDGEDKPSIKCPLGAFFGMGHGLTKNFWSTPLQMSPRKGKGFNCWWPMPFKKHARIEIENNNSKSWVPFYPKLLKKNPGINLYYYIDYEQYDEWPNDINTPLGYFHCQYRRVDYRKDVKRDRITNRRYKPLQWQFYGGKNIKGQNGYDRNHIILEASGRGNYVGCHINIQNRWRWTFNWPGEGDDMIFIDEDINNEPTLHGTGTEDYVNMAYCPRKRYNSPYHGIIKGGKFNWFGKITYYRYHIEDPISFKRKILVTIEHGHNNLRGDIWETVAYWYQTEPHKHIDFTTNLT
ncbi:MAG: glycoside hydrolase family 172 protein [Candidatus Heimdallarchaeaceae archaeon]